MMYCSRLGLVLLLVSGMLLATSATAKTEAEKAIEYRQAYMQVLRWNLGSMKALLEAEGEFDRETFARLAGDLAATTRMNVERGFPEDSDEGDKTEAMAEIWLDWEGFAERLQALRDQAGKLAEVARGGDKAAIKAQYKKTGKACKGCHDNYRE